MPQVELANAKRINEPPSWDGPHIGFAKPTKPPMWWYVALTIMALLFITIILLFVYRMILKSLGGISTSTTATSSKSADLKVSPYLPQSFSSPLPFQDFEILITKDGITSPPLPPSLHIDDVVSIFNTDTVAHQVIIQEKSYSLSPNEVHGYKISKKDILKIEILDKGKPNRTFSFLIK